MKLKLRRNVLWIILITLVTTAMTSQITVATQLTKLSVSPIKVMGVAVGNTFTINITVADVTKLWGYQFLLHYNTTILTATQYTNLANLTYTPFNIASPSEINDTAGYVAVAYSCPPGDNVGLTTVDPVALAAVTFRVDALGTTKLDLDEDHTVLADTQGNAIRVSWGNLILVDGYFSNTEEIKLHDVAVIGVTVNTTTFKPGDVIAIEITVKNNGDFNETFTVSAKYHSISTFLEIGTETVTNLVIGASTTVNFFWNTADIAWGKYFIRVVATLPEDDNPADNVRDSAIITAEFHDVAITFVEAYPTSVMPGRSVWIDVEVANEGTITETFNVTVYYDANIIGKETTWNLFPSEHRWLGFSWDTTDVAEGRYTISAVADVVPSETDTIDNTYINGIVTVSVPRISISPTSGPVGTKVKVEGYSFPPVAGAYLTFDDQLIGLIYTDANGSFVASFNVPFSEVGLHTVKVTLYYYPYPITAEATFTVTDVTPIDVSIDVGTIFFKGETVEFYVQTALNGKPIEVTFIKGTLYKPDGTTETLTAQRIASGLYQIRYTISGKGTMTGTYTLVVEASSSTDIVNAYGTSIKTFIVKPTWEREAPKIATFSIASIGLVAAMVLLWRKEKKKLL